VKRREFITLLGGAAAWPLAARAQQPAMPVIGFLHCSSPETSGGRLNAFRQGLKDMGFVENENVAVEYRWANNQNERLPELAAELVRQSVAVKVHRAARRRSGSMVARGARAAAGDNTCHRISPKHGP